MITHSFIVSALLAFSLVAQANIIAIDGKSGELMLVEAATYQNAVLHKDVGLHQGMENGKDVVEAQVLVHCVGNQNCPSVDSAPPHVQTLADLFIVNKQPSGKSSLLLLMFFVCAVIIFLRGGAFSTK